MGFILGISRHLNTGASVSMMIELRYLSAFSHEGLMIAIEF